MKINNKADMKIKMHLAEYKYGKVYRFLELGKDFMYGGDFILVNCLASYNDEDDHTDWPYGDSILQGNKEEFYGRVFKLDKTDPLKRNGLFDGRTYGNGSFALSYKLPESI